MRILTESYGDLTASKWIKEIENKLKFYQSEDSDYKVIIKFSEDIKGTETYMLEIDKPSVWYIKKGNFKYINLNSIEYRIDSADSLSHAGKKCRIYLSTKNGGRVTVHKFYYWFPLMTSVTENNLQESSVVTFYGQSEPKFGWCVVMAGGPGSGKTYTTTVKGNLRIQGKMIDSDKLKKYYTLMHPGEYDLENNPEDVLTVHKIVKDKAWRAKILDAFFSDLSYRKNRLPNIIFDIMGAYSGQMSAYADRARYYGYKTALVWIVTNVNVAAMRNVDKKTRKRGMPEDSLRNLHRKVLNTLMYHKKYIANYAGDHFDECWLIISSAPTNDMTAAEKELLDSMCCIRLEKKNGQFDFADKVEEFVKKITNRHATDNGNTFDYFQDLKQKSKEKQRRQPRPSDFKE